MENHTFNESLSSFKQSDVKMKERIEISEAAAKIINGIMYARINKNLSQRDLAKRCGIPQSAIARMERLQVMPRIDTVIKIARHVGINLYTQNVDEYQEEVTLTSTVYITPPQGIYKNISVNRAAYAV